MESKCSDLTGTPAARWRTAAALIFPRWRSSFGDKRVVPFSFSTDPESVQKRAGFPSADYTNEETHQQIITVNNLDRSPLFSGCD